MTKILFIKNDGLGDLVLINSVFCDLQKLLNCEVHLITCKSNEQLAKNLDYVKKIYYVSRGRITNLLLQGTYMDRESQLREEILLRVKELYDIKFKNETFEPGKTPVRYAGRVFDEDEMQQLSWIPLLHLFFTEAMKIPTGKSL